MVILGDLIWRYTQGESSSVATDTAESILTSILYAVDTYLLNLEHPNQAITYLKTSDVVKLCEKRGGTGQSMPRRGKVTL
ncbi:DUF6179 domain-containing protein [Alicyclobacillus kakegawensis]|uniref:DUF6179 domain-containing protein n=1 Tax=Alicyclobacillus kakegawensis TaxID=392012 RepID=UPI0034E28C0B